MATSSIPWGSTDPNREATTAEDLMILGVGDCLCGCPITAVREIVGWRPVTRWPGAPAAIAGLINLRGAILTVADLGVYLGLSPANRNTGSIVLIERGTKAIGLAVDALYEVRHADERADANHPWVRLDVDEIMANVLA